MIKAEKRRYIWFNKPVLKEGRRNPKQNCKFHVGSKNSHFSNDAHLCYRLLKELHKHSTARPAVFPSEPYQITNTDYSLYICSSRLHSFFSKYQGFGPLSLK